MQTVLLPNFVSNLRKKAYWKAKRRAARELCGRGAARGQVPLLVIRYIKGKSTIFEHKAWEVCRLSFSEGV
jgi:hypothetical protein